MDKVSASTRGKVILFGEHAVVYGKMALVASISMGVKAQVEESGAADKSELVKKAIEVAGGDENIQLRIESELPIGSGLGSSAAVSACVIKAVRQYLGEPVDNDELFQLTMECERLAHGNPSGVDPACVVYGGLIAFIKGQPFERLQIKNKVKFLLVNSGQPSESTMQMVEKVADNSRKNKIIEEIGEIAILAKEEIVRERDITELINRNGLLLEELGVVGLKAKKLSQKLRLMGAGVKITGAGGLTTGSGMMIVVAPDFAKIKELLDNSQIDYFETSIGES